MSENIGFLQQGAPIFNRLNSTRLAEWQHRVSDVLKVAVRLQPTERENEDARSSR